MKVECDDCGAEETVDMAGPTLFGYKTVWVEEHNPDSMYVSTDEGWMCYECLEEKYGDI